MQTSLRPALAFYLREEGGYVNDPHDPGGATNHGITIATLSRWIGKPATLAEVRALTPEMASAIMEYDYLAPVGFNALPPGADLLVGDISINSGQGEALTCWAACKASVDPIAAIDNWRRGFWRHLQIFKFYGKGWFAREDRGLALARQLETQAHVGPTQSPVDVSVAAASAIRNF